MSSLTDIVNKVANSITDLVGNFSGSTRGQNRAPQLRQRGVRPKLRTVVLRTIPPRYQQIPRLSIP